MNQIKKTVRDSLNYWAERYTLICHRPDVGVFIFLEDNDDDVAIIVQADPKNGNFFKEVDVISLVIINALLAHGHKVAAAIAAEAWADGVWGEK